MATNVITGTLTSPVLSSNIGTAHGKLRAFCRGPRWRRFAGREKLRRPVSQLITKLLDDGDGSKALAK